MISDLRDIAEDVFYEEILSMPAVPVSLPPGHADRERQYREFWPAVRALLRTRYSGLDDQEEIYQEAWTELLEYEASGNVVRDTRALLKTIAERRARDRLRNYRPVVADPESVAFLGAVDAAPSPEEQVQVRLDAAAIRQVIDILDEREAAALKLRYDLLLDAAEISRRLGIAPKRLEKVMTSAYRQIADALAPEAGGESPWSRRQRSLLLACEAGVASERQRQKASRMLEVDPRCRATLAELREAARDVAAVLPLPVVAAEPERTRRVFEVLTDAVDRFLPGSRRAGRQLAESVAPSTSAEPVAAGVAALGAGGAAKLALVCLAAGGTAAVCLGVNRSPVREAPKAEAAPRVVAPKPTFSEPRAGTLLASRPKIATPAKARRRAPTSTRPPAKTETPVSSKTSLPAISPAPAGSTEFGPGAVGSAPAPTQPAVAPSNGGGEFTP